MAIDDGGEHQAEAGLSRRRMLRNAGLLAGAAWTVPTVMALEAPAALASPAGCTVCNGTNLMGTAGTGQTAAISQWCQPTPAGGSQGKVISDGTAFRPGTNATVGLWYALFVSCFSAQCTARFAQGGVTATVTADIAQGTAGNPQTGVAAAASNKARLNLVFHSGTCPTSTGAPNACVGTLGPNLGTPIGLTNPAYTGTSVYPSFTTLTNSALVPTGTTYFSMVLEIGRESSTVASAIKNISVTLSGC